MFAYTLVNTVFERGAPRGGRKPILSECIYYDIDEHKRMSVAEDVAERERERERERVGREKEKERERERE